MRVGRTSFIFSISKFISSILGFVATLYFARVLGAEVLGFYALTTTIVSWLQLGGKIGFGGAIKKRISEGEKQSQYAAAGGVIILGLGALLGLMALVGHSYIDSYVGRPVTPFVVALLILGLFMAYLNSLLSGYQLVHIVGMLDPVRIGSRSILQIGLVVAGLSLSGMLYGYIGGLIVAISVALVYTPLKFRMPRREQFQSLFEYAKFAWLGNLRYRAFNDVDILILGVFVQSNLIGIYSVAWSITKFLTVFDSAISSTIFPEISNADHQGDLGLVKTLISDSLQYSGLILIPGFVGSLILATDILEIYGPEFTEGAHVMSILILAGLVYAYQKQFVNALNAIDRPALSFRANGVFIVTNILLNFTLVYYYGWIGAAVATLLSAGISLFFGAYYLKSEIEFEIPSREISQQVIAALGMGCVAYAGVVIENTHRVIRHNFATVLIIVAVGAATYTVFLFVISPSFRETVEANSPVEIPYRS